MNEPKICPLLTIADQGTVNDCQGDRCAITYLASISYGVRNT